jgi:SAM-dependent methyltransferase
MVQHLLDSMARQPLIWNAFRSIAEAGFRADYDVIERELNPLGGDTSRRFLDFGCGTGQFASCFPVDRYAGFDIAKHYVHYANRRHPHQFSVMSGDALGYADSTFDAALIMGVFHHFDDALVEASVRELHRVLRPHSTVLLIEDIPAQNRWNLLGRAMHWLDRGDNIRSVAHYSRLLEPHFRIERSHQMLSGICDLAVYVLKRNDL